MVLRADPVPEQVDKILQNLLIKVAVGVGAAANTNIAVTGIATTDKLVAVIEFAAPEELAGIVAVFDRTAQSSITSAGNIQVTVATNTNAQRRLLIIWLDIT
jgi:hypothetical protein